MKLHVRSIVLLVPLLLTACAHKKDQTQVQPPLAPPIEDAPLPQPNKAPTNLPPPEISVPKPEPPPASTAHSEPTPPPPKRPAHRRKPPATKPSTSASTPPTSAAPAQDTEQAANGTPEVSAIGQLSTGSTGDLRQQTVDSIADTEKGLNGINRKLSDQEQKTSSQIREFLKQAKTALAGGDIDGAHTLALKAKVLLGELNQ